VPLLERLKTCAPDGVKVMILADRFFGSPELVSAYRGFRFQDTHLQRPERISRMLLVLTIAMTWATANGQIVQKKPRSRAA